MFYLNQNLLIVSSYHVEQSTKGSVTRYCGTWFERSKDHHSNATSHISTIIRSSTQAQVHTKSLTEKRSRSRIYEESFTKTWTVGLFARSHNREFSASHGNYVSLFNGDSAYPLAV